MTNRTLIGDFGGGDYRIRMSKPGFDVTAALDPERLAFDSAWKDGATVYKIGTVARNTSVSFGETLPSIPFVYYWKILAGSKIMTGVYATNNSAFVAYYARVTTTSLIITGSAFDALDGTIFGYMVLRPMANG
jgi:hypothetical protein